MAVTAGDAACGPWPLCDVAAVEAARVAAAELAAAAAKVVAAELALAAAVVSFVQPALPVAAAELLGSIVKGEGTAQQRAPASKPQCAAGGRASDFGDRTTFDGFRSFGWATRSFVQLAESYPAVPWSPSNSHGFSDYTRRPRAGDP